MTFDSSPTGCRKTRRPSRQWNAVPFLLLMTFLVHAQSPGSAPIVSSTENMQSSLWPASDLAVSCAKIKSSTGKTSAVDAGRSGDAPGVTTISEQLTSSSAAQPAVSDKTDSPRETLKASSALTAQQQRRPDRNLDIYYRNRREFSLDIGYHPVNIPFVFDFAVGDSYNMTSLKYTLVPIIASLRWHVTNVGWRWIFRGNMDFTFSGSITPIPRGPETHYYSLDFGIRRNFVYRNWRVVPYFEQRGGAGIINAKEPLGIQFAQGQNLTFTYNMGAGARYNITDKYALSVGMNYMHVSNAYLSQPSFYNYGINVYGPMLGFDMRLGKPRHRDSQ